MSFYEDPSFFLLLALAVVPAVILGLLERRIRIWGLVSSWAFLALLFEGDWAGLAMAAAYMIVNLVLARAVLASMACGPRGADKRKPPRWLRPLALVGCLAPLVVYKLTVAAGTGIGGFLGISYISFKATQVLLEIEDGLITELPAVDYLYFLSFFCTFTSGPIDRSRRFFADVDEPLPRWRYLDGLGRGIVMLAAGLVMQLPLATIAKQAYQPAALDLAAPVVPQLGAAATCALAYAAYLYLDFAGYSLMAQGASLCFGVATPANLRMPFLSRFMEEFWGRWNTTLSHWLRDFVFMRLERALTRRRWPRSRDDRASMGLVANMLLMGAWHGVCAQYLAYGAYHGILLAVEQRVRKHSRLWRANHDRPLFQLGSWLVTMVLVVFGLSIFSGQLFTFLGGIHG